MEYPTWREAIVEVLKEAGTAMHYTDIAEEIVARGMRAHVGATPAATVNSQICVALKDGESSPFVRVGRGEYVLQDFVDADSEADVSQIQGLPERDEPDAGIIRAFGMYWERSNVLWGMSCALLGRQQIGADPVDFAGQRGVYLLHDHRETIYVGRATDRPLGRRLYEHTQNRHRSRWNRFSWFGIMAVSEEGRLCEAPLSVSSDTVISTMEALLIEGLEPRQNRKRGDDFSAIEYLQAEDPAVERQQMRDLLRGIQDRLEV